MKALLGALVAKSGSVLVAIFVIIMLLQVFVGWILDSALDLIFLGVLTGALKLDQLKAWLDKR